MAQGKIILLNGTSSSGKSTIAKSLQSQLPEPFWHLTAHHLLLGKDQLQGAMNLDQIKWDDIGDKFLNGLYGAVLAFVQAGNNVIFEIILESEQWVEKLAEQFHELDIFLVGLDCSISIAESREASRGEQKSGLAQKHIQTHSYALYDLVIDAEKNPAENAGNISAAWQRRGQSEALRTMA